MTSAVVLGMVVIVAHFRRGSVACAWLALVGLVLLGAVLAVTLAIEVPIDNQTTTWTTSTLPADWTRIRAGLAGFHTLRTCLSLAGPAAVVAAGLATRPAPRTPPPQAATPVGGRGAGLSGSAAPGHE